jgi:ATP-dependent helicase/nuclease subunit A
VTRLIDQEARELFASDLGRNYVVNANAGSGKTTAIAQRLAEMTMIPEAADSLSKTVVVTFTRKAALELRQRARSEVLALLSRRPDVDEGALEKLDRSFFGTIHSFCLLLGRRHGQPLGVNLDPEVVEDGESAEIWERFVQHDSMQFESVGGDVLRNFLRFQNLDGVFSLAQTLAEHSSRFLLKEGTIGSLPDPDWNAFDELMNHASIRRGKAKDNFGASQRALSQWAEAFRREFVFLPIIRPIGKGKDVVVLFERFFSPIKQWSAEVAGRLAAELAQRYREYRREQGVQTYLDQIEVANRLLERPAILDRIRREGYRILLDEAQDTDSLQFRVLVEIARPPGASLGDWPGDGPPPRPGHFCLVGDGQQSIFGGRADIRNYLKHVEAYREESSGNVLDFGVTFRLPSRLIDFMNDSVAPSFSESVSHNRGIEGHFLQVPYLQLSPRPDPIPGQVSRCLFARSAAKKVDDRLEDELRNLAQLLVKSGPIGIGACKWSDICVLAPRRDWLETARCILDREGIPVSLRTRASRNGDRPAYAWVAGLLSVVVDPENGFEWVGILREIFGVSDAVLADCVDGEPFDFGSPDRYPMSLREPLSLIRPFVLGCDESGVDPVSFLDDLVDACRIRDRLHALGSGIDWLEDLEAVRTIACAVTDSDGGVRDLHQRLIKEVDNETPSEPTGADAVNLLTCHSSKGLEWPVVIPIGLWRPLLRGVDQGFSLVDAARHPRVYFDRASIPVDTELSHKRELARETMRLLYVTLTRAQRHLVLSLPDDLTGSPGSFLEIWSGGDSDPLSRRLGSLPDTSEVVVEASITVPDEAPPAIPLIQEPSAEILERAVAFSSECPTRRLPHELANAKDQVRAARHEAVLDEPTPHADSSDPIDYGIWWHETMELFPWRADQKRVDEFVQSRVTIAGRDGFAERGQEELFRFLASELWDWLRDPGLVHHTEIPVFAPGKSGEWIDGVLDMLCVKDGMNELTVIDWKTNRPRPGEPEGSFLDWLGSTYRAQLSAYARAIARAIGGEKPALKVYSTVCAKTIEIEGG